MIDDDSTTDTQLGVLGICHACKGRPYAECQTCGCHYMPSHASGACFDCRGGDL